ncbi:MAG: hypothetical protein ACREB6_00580 [Rhodospirillales bacterium]
MADAGYHRKAYLRKAENEPPQRTKPRHCLKCQAPFTSAWAGERVCPKCKTSGAWRDGIAANMASWSRW